MGVVYKARDPIINRLVALKVIKANVADNPALLERFYREAQSAGSLQHPNIVTIYEMGEEGGIPFIAMQLVDGQNLGNLIAQRASIPLSLKLVYAVEACSAFAYAHKQGIVHRDIKPGNVMVSKDGTVKVVDFGIARVLENSRTQTGMLIGTFAYMPPEVFNGEHADERSDIFSFGVLLYELFAYKHPFPGDIPASLMQSICLKEPIPLHQVAPDCPPELEAVVHRALVKTVADRTQTMEDLLLELDPICKGLRAQTSADLVAQARGLIQQSEFTRARELLLQAIQIDFSNRPARSLLDEVNADLKRILIRPKVEKHIQAGQAFLDERKVQEAQLEVESALKLDPSYKAAEELLRRIQQEIGRAKLLSEWLQASGECLAEGLPEEAEALVAKIQEIDPANQQAAQIERQITEEKTRRQRRIRLLETMQQARTLWMQQKYEDCIDLLTSLQEEYGDEEEVQKLLVTVREDRAEQGRRQLLDRARTFLVAGSYEECKSSLASLSSQFPNDEEIQSLLGQVRKEEAERQKLEGLTEARNLLAARRYEDCLLLLASLKNEFPEEREILTLVEAVREDKETEEKEQGLKEARSLLASQRYDECRELLTGLQNQFPTDPGIPKLIEAVREEQAEQRRLEGISEAQQLLSSKQYVESLALLGKLKAQFPDDKEIPSLVETIQKDQAEQQRVQGLAEAQKLRASKQYAEALTLLGTLKTQFRDDNEIIDLGEAVQKDQAEQRRFEGMSEAQQLLSSKQYAESLSLLGKLKAQFPDDKEIPSLVETIQKDQAEQQRVQGLAEAQKLRASKQYAEALTLLGTLKTQFRNDNEIIDLSEAVQKDQTEQRKLEGLLKARKLFASRLFAESLALLDDLRTHFPDDKEILRLAEAVLSDQAEQLKQQGLAETRKLRASKQYAEALTLLSKLKTQFPSDKDITRLVEGVLKDQTEQQKQQGLSEARQMLTSRRLDEAFALLNELRQDFPHDGDITRLLATVEQEQAEQQKQERIAEARALLGSKSFAEALKVLDPLLAVNVNDPGVLKLRALILDEQEKIARVARRTSEMQILKKLVSDEAYETVISRAEALLRDIPNDVDVVRLLDFARNRKDQIDRERQLSQIVEDVKKLIASNQLVKAIAATRHALDSFAGNSELTRLLGQAEGQHKKEFTRLHIQQRIREIKTKIHREEFSDAVRLAQDALTTLGPDTDLTQLLTSAQIETQSRNKKREQGQKLENVRALLEIGDLEGATLLLDNTIKTEHLDTADPRVERLSKEIAAATASRERTVVPAAPETHAKEYALLEGPPQIDAPDQQGPTEEHAVPAATANQATSSLPQPDVTPRSEIAPAAAAQAVEAPIVRIPAEVALAPGHIQEPSLPVPLWKRPSSLIAETLGLVLLALMGAYLLHRSKLPLVTSRSVSQPSSNAPMKNTPEMKQRDLITAADKAIAQGDFYRAKTALEEAKTISGPLSPAIDQRLVDVERAINNAAAAAVLQQEETLWSQATADTENGKFAEAQQVLRAILELPADGRRKAEARQFLTEVIPRREREEKLFAQAQQAMNGKDSRSFQRAADLFGEAAKLKGPKEQAALKNQQDALANLNSINALAGLTNGARQDMTRGDFRSARQKAAQVLQTGGDLAPLSQEIDKAEQTRFSQLDASLNQLKQRSDEGAVQSLRDLQSQFQALVDSGGPTSNDARRDAVSIPDAIAGVQGRVTYERDETAYQQSIQRYRASANDKAALDATRSDFQSIMRGGGHRAADAQKIVDDINAKLALLNQPPNPTKPNAPFDETPAVLAAVQRYTDAFDQRDAEALRQVWPTMTPQDYGKFKSSFSGASGIQLQVENEKVELGVDGATAVVNADITRNYIPKAKGEKPLLSRDHTIFHLVKNKGAWVIKDLQ